MRNNRISVGIILVFVLAFGTATSLAMTRTITIRVHGMTCGGCATSVENALKSTNGVEEARVNFKNGRAVIKYDDQKVTVARLREVISNTGFFCDVENPSGKRDR